jgi:hypothetical protein
MLYAKAFLRGTSTGRAGGFRYQQKRAEKYISVLLGSLALDVPKATPGSAGGKKIAYSEE